MASRLRYLFLCGTFLLGFCNHSWGQVVGGALSRWLLAVSFFLVSNGGNGQMRIDKGQVVRRALSRWLLALSFLLATNNADCQMPIAKSQLPKAQAEIETRKCLVKTARIQLFVREKTGHNDGTEILKYLKPLGFKEGTPYCGAFLNWVFMQCGVKHHVVGPAAAYHWMKEPSRRLWYMGRSVAKTAPQQGDVAVFNWRKRYHCELVIEWVDDEDEEDFMTIGANTSVIKGDGSGEGVHRKMRPKDIAVVSNHVSFALSQKPQPHF